MTELMQNEIERTLEQYGQALSTGDLVDIADGWTVPALVLDTTGAIAVAQRSEVEAFFGRAVEWYRSRGLASTRPDDVRVESLGGGLAAVDVRWRAYDAAGQEQSSERSYYILHRGDDGRWRIRVALTRTE